MLRRPHRRKKNQCVMNRQQSTSISGKHHPENHKGEGSRPSLPLTAPIPTGCDVLWHFRPRACSLLRTLKNCPGPPDAIKARGASLGFHSASACRGRHAYTTAPS